MPEISVIFGYRNRDLTRVKRCLDSFTNQIFTDFEIVFVDYGSDIKKAQEAEQLAYNYPNVKYIYSNTRGREWNRAHALNTGVKQASGKYLLFSDVDIIFTPGVLEALYSNRDAFDHQHCEVFNLPREFSDWQRLQTEQPVTIRTFGTDGKGGVHFLIKTIFEEVGAYDEYYCHWGLEDRDLYQRLEVLGKSHCWINHEQTPVYHQWHPSATYKSHFLMPDKWWDQMNIYYSLNKHKPIRNQNYGVLFTSENRPIQALIDYSNLTSLSYIEIGSAIEKCEMYDDIITRLSSGESGEIVKLKVHKEELIPQLGRWAKRWKALVTTLIAVTNIQNYQLLPALWEKLANRQQYTIPFIDVRYLVWNIIRDTSLIQDYYFLEEEDFSIIYLMRS